MDAVKHGRAGRPVAARCRRRRRALGGRRRHQHGPRARRRARPPRRRGHGRPGRDPRAARGPRPVVGARGRRHRRGRRTGTPRRRARPRRPRRRPPAGAVGRGLARRPRRPADGAHRAPRRRLRRRRGALVPHAVRPRQHLGGPDGAAARHRPRRRHAAHPGGPAGHRHDVPTQQQPGKILHELRRAATVLDCRATQLPPVYYGTVDATPLFVCLLHDAWRWGLPDDEVRALLPAARAALDWVVRWGDADGDGLLEYVDTEGTGLANQGWKDSGDSVRFADGRQATAPIALAEVQGYAHEALLHGADLLAALGDDDVSGYREVAAGLRQRFADAFWVDGDAGATRRWPWMPTRPGSTPWPATWATCPVPACSTPDDEARRRRRAHPRRQRLRLRPAHHVVEVRRVLPAQLPLRLGVAARHRDHAARPLARRAGRSRRGPAVRSGRGGRGVRLPPARAVVGRRARRGRPARPVPRRLPPAGVVGDVGGRRRAGAAGAPGRRPRGRRDAASAAPEPGRARCGSRAWSSPASPAPSRSTPTARCSSPRAPACGGRSSADADARYVPRCTDALDARPATLLCFDS